MSNSLYSFVDVENKSAPKTTLKDAVNRLLRVNDGECYAKLEIYLIPPGVSGSRSFDQAYAVQQLLECDRAGEGDIAKILASTPTLKHRNLWDVLQNVLRTAGFKMKHGRLVGVLEDMRTEDEKNADSGQPDID